MPQARRLDLCKAMWPLTVQVYAYEESEKYKEGKYIIERAHIAKLRFKKLKDQEET